MMMPGLLFSTPWLSRAAAVLLLTMVVSIVYLWGIVPLREAYADVDARIAEARDMALRTERVAAQRDALGAEVRRLSSQPENAVYYLAGETEAVAGAALQARVSAVIGSSRGNLGSIQALPGIDDQGLRRIAVRVQLSGDIETLLASLHGLETGLPLLFIGDLGVQSQGPAAMIAGASPAASMLTVSAEIYGYLPPASAATLEPASP